MGNITPSNPQGLDLDDKHISFVQVNKGRIVLPYTRAVHSFMFNPTQVKTKHGWKWGKQSIFGHSHDVLQGGSGEPEDVEFTLIIDGDRGRSDKRKAAGGGAAGPTSNDTSLDVSAELNFYKSLTFPTKASPTVSGGYITGSTPPVFVLTLGTMFTKVSCVMESVEITVVKFSPTLEPIHATVALKMTVYAPVPIYMNDVYESADPDSTPDLSGVLSMAGSL